MCKKWTLSLSINNGTNKKNVVVVHELILYCNLMYKTTQHGCTNLVAAVEVVWVCPSDPALPASQGERNPLPPLAQTVTGAAVGGSLGNTHQPQAVCGN